MSFLSLKVARLSEIDLSPKDNRSATSNRLKTMAYVNLEPSRPTTTSQEPRMTQEEQAGIGTQTLKHLRPAIISRNLYLFCAELISEIERLVDLEPRALGRRNELLERQNNDLSIKLTATIIQLAEMTKQAKQEKAHATRLEKHEKCLLHAEAAAATSVKRLEMRLVASENSNKLLTEEKSSLAESIRDLILERDKVNAYADEVETTNNKLQTALQNEQYERKTLNTQLVYLKRCYDGLQRSFKDQMLQGREWHNSNNQKDYDTGALLFALFSHMGKVYDPCTLQDILTPYFSDAAIEGLMSREVAYGKWVRGALNRESTLIPTSLSTQSLKYTTVDALNCDTTSHEHEKDPEMSRATGQEQSQINL